MGVVLVLDETGPGSHHSATLGWVCQGDNFSAQSLLQRHHHSYKLPSEYSVLSTTHLLEQISELLQQVRSILAPGLWVDQDEEGDG